MLQSTDGEHGEAGAGGCMLTGSAIGRKSWESRRMQLMYSQGATSELDRTPSMALHIR